MAESRKLLSPFGYCRKERSANLTGQKNQSSSIAWTASRGRALPSPGMSTSQSFTSRVQKNSPSDGLHAGGEGATFVIRFHLAVSRNLLSPSADHVGTAGEGAGTVLKAASFIYTWSLQF